MTNSTDKTAPKKKGPIRTGAVAPTIIFIVLGLLYGRFFFDSHVKSVLEWTATYVHGAEVNIGSLDSSFFGGSLSIEDIQVTDKKMAGRNLIQIGRVHFEFLWDALLRAKFVVENAGIENIQVYVPRSSPGEVLAEEKMIKKPVGQLKNKVLESSKEEFEGSALGDVASVAGGTRVAEQAQTIRGELKSEKRANELNAELDRKQREWAEKVQSFDYKKELEALSNKAKNIKFDKSKPWESLKQYKVIGNAIKQKMSEYKEAAYELRNDLTGFQKGFSEIDQLAKNDLKDLQGRYDLTSMDPQDIAKRVFGKMIREKFGNVLTYVEVARQYLPNKKGASKKQIVPPKRGEGRTYQFPVTTGYPLFWLKKAAVSSKVTANPHSGDVSGEFTNFTSDPVYLGKPAIFKFNGRFPKQGGMSVQGKITLDHTTETAKDSINMNVSSAPVKKMSLIESDKLSFGLKKAVGQYALNAEVIEQNMNFYIHGQFKKPDYRIESGNKIVKSIFEKSVQKIPFLSFTARAQGPYERLSWSMSSNIGEALSRGIKSEFKDRVDEQKLKYQKMIDDRLSGKKDALMKKYEKIRSEISNMLSQKDKDIESTGQEALKGTEKKEEIGTSPKDLLKKFKF